MNGALAFVDTSDCTMMNIAEHYMASDVEWDPTGRYVVTSVSWWSHKVQAAPIDWSRVLPSSVTVAHCTCVGNSHCELTSFSLLFSCVRLGGQRILAVDVPGSSPSEEQQGPLLSAALETQTSHPAQRRPDQGAIVFIEYIVCVCGAADDTLNNFSDSLYESCTALYLIKYSLILQFLAVEPFFAVNIPLPLSDDQEGSQEILQDL